MTPLLISFVAGIIIPAITELVTKSNAPAWVRSVLNLLLSSLAGAVATASVGNMGLTETLSAVAVAWVGSMRSHYAGISKPVADSTPSIGIGKKE